MLIVEIILTIVAWRNGWRGWAILPLVIILFMGFMIGLISGAMGFSEIQVRQLSLAFLPFEFIGIGFLIWMSFKGRKKLKEGISSYIPEKSKLEIEKV